MVSRCTEASPCVRQGYEYWADESGEHRGKKIHELRYQCHDCEWQSNDKKAAVAHSEVLWRHLVKDTDATRALRARDV